MGSPWDLVPSPSNPALVVLDLALLLQAPDRLRIVLANVARDMVGVP